MLQNGYARIWYVPAMRLLAMAVDMRSLVHHLASALSADLYGVIGII